MPTEIMYYKNILAKKKPQDCVCDILFQLIWPHSKDCTPSIAENSAFTKNKTRGWSR